MNAASNLTALMIAMRFDGDIPIGGTSKNLLYKMATEDGLELWFASFSSEAGANYPACDIEAYVVADDKGNLTYYDMTTDAVVVNNILNPNFYGTRHYEELDAMGVQYDLECHNPKPGAIKAMLELVHKFNKE
jgi:hypothetical protein